MRLGTITRLWRYPVKSMGGEEIPAATLSWRGIPGDRGWAVYDETRQGVTGAKRLPALRAVHARYPGTPVAGEASPAVELTFPDGERVSTDSPEAQARLTGYLGRPVTLRPLGPAGSEAPRRLTMEGESDETVRELMGLVPGEPMPDLSAFPPERLRLLRQGNFFDALPLHLITGTTLATLERLAPESSWDVRRFRPNLLVDAIQRGGYPELDWIGKRLRVGGAEIELVTGCPRCVVVTQAVGDLPSDPRVMRTLVREIRHTAGVYASVSREGEVRLGDEVTLLT